MLLVDVDRAPVEDQLRGQNRSEMDPQESPKPSSSESVQAACGDKAEGHVEGEHVYYGDNLSTPHQALFIGTICMTMFTTQIGLTQTLGILYVIGDWYGITNPGVLSWLVAGYSLTVGTFILVAGRFGDDFGHKRIYIIGLAWYALWSLIAGLAVFSDHVLFVFARVFQGLGPAMTLPMGLAILGQAFSNGPKKNMAFALFGGSAPVGAITGFTTGGLFVLPGAWWPWAYWSSAIALACLTIFSAWVIPDTPVNGETQKRSLRETLAHLDPLGMATGVIALVLFNFAWNQSIVVGWQQVYVYVCLILGVVFAAIFFLVELHWASTPILPVAVFTSDVAFVLACTACGWACFGIWVFYAATFITQLRGVTPLQLAAWYSPVIPSGLLAAFAVGKLLGKISPAWIMVIGMLGYSTGSILIATMPIDQTYWGQFFFGVLIMGVGMDTSFPAATIIFSNAVPARYQGMGASLVATIVNYSISLGLGFAGTVELQVNDGGITQQQKLHGYRGAFYMELGLAGLGLALSLIFVAKECMAGRSKKAGVSGRGNIELPVD